ncbi:MAG: DUF5615 family PIN-like protein [Nostoc sp.]|uniref:DUF5615 family PIN-like protein n=1 Tax=Nostoc sp. TaxID=1180 RepID=UPI002FFA686E
MARLYADEQFPYQVVEHLRDLGHDVLTVQEAGNANLKIPDDEVLAFANSNEQVVLTLNRRDFKRLHRLQPTHAGIIICTDDVDRSGLAQRIHAAILAAQLLTSILDLLHKSKIRTPPRQSYALSPLPTCGEGLGWGVRDFCKRSID